MTRWDAGSEDAQVGLPVDEAPALATGRARLDLVPAPPSRGVRAGPASTPQDRRGLAVPVRPSRPAAARATLGRVPVDAFVSIGPRLNLPPHFSLAAPDRTANDNAPTAKRGRVRWRDVFFLVLLAATLAGAFWSGRLHAMQRVIVVPDASSARSVVT